MRSLCLAVLLAGCAAPIAPAQESTPPRASTSPPPETPPPAPEAPTASTAAAQRFTPAPGPAEDVAALLAPFALDSRQPARRTLFSWTTRAQAEALGKTKKLLVKGADDTTVQAPFEQRIRYSGGPQLGSRLMAMMSKPPLDKHRYAFANPIGWAVGVTGAPYGPVLVRITLRDDAIVLLLGRDPDPELAPLRAVRVNGTPVGAAEVERQPERVAAVFHEDIDPRGIPFREYIVVNEGMIESWAVGTADVQSEIDRARKALERLSAVSPEEERPDNTELFAAWQGQRVSLPSTPWGISIGVGSAPYAWTRKNVAAIAAHLARAERVDPVEHRPERARALKLPPPPPPPKKPPQRVWID